MAVTERAVTERPVVIAGSSASHDDKSMGSLFNELKDLIIAYAKQETVDPLKALGRFVLWGVVGAILLGVGGGLLALAAVRAIQFETAPHLLGDWSWTPYVGGILLAAVAAGWAASRIGKSDMGKRAR